tara:strand:- start:2768 stop:3964 length:1197 start_codon:yes stop_codon:yes gene_type:complete
MSLNVTNVTDHCNICGSSELAEIFATRKMPLTGLYLQKPNENNELCNDQTLLHCEECGHGQLKYIISPNDLYDNSYKHRSTESTISSTGNDFFHSYLNEITHGKDDFKGILEVGCNDLVLIKKIQDIGSKIVGIDPIWVGKDFSYNQKTEIVGCFVDEISQHIDKSLKPDLILSAHTFEHVDKTFEQFSKLVEIASDDCLFLIEMPSYDTLLKTGRFDQVFHQHLQYISLNSMIALIDRLGCEYVGHKYNHSYWGGTLLFSFRKNRSSQNISNPKFETKDASMVTSKFTNFKWKLSKDLELLINIKEPIYGFGAAQMLPIIAHHFSSDLSFLEGIIDDNPTRIGTYLPSISCPIVSSSSVENINDVICLITAIDSSRPIMSRILELNPRRIAQLFPLI